MPLVAPDRGAARWGDASHDTRGSCRLGSLTALYRQTPRRLSASGVVPDVLGLETRAGLV